MRMRLHALLAERRAEVMQRWLDAVRGTLHPESMPHVELVDHLPLFIDQVIAALHHDHAPDELEVAEEHGGQRLALGFSLDAVVREYGAMRTAIVDVAKAAGIEFSTRDYQVVFDCVITGIAGAVSEYSRQRDAEMQRQATEHFSFVAHELRNPLSSATLALDNLEARNAVDPKDRAMMALSRGLHVMRDLIDHTLRLARVGSGVDLKPEPVQLRALLEESEAAVALDAAAKGIRVEVEIEGDHELVVDVRLVRSALSNLVRNAVKFTHADGRVTIRGKVTSGRAIIEIEDGCGGLPPEDLEKVFSPFVQLGPSASSGFGLGLAIARQAVDAHTGTLRVQNLPDHGCIFVLELPTSPA
ncbi:MAG: sensor histidine kinase [Kofleriaceae bacterium]